MKKTIQLNKQNIDYTLKKSKRAKRMRLAVYCDGSCVVTAPQALPQTMIEKFLIKKSQWVLDKIEYFRSLVTNVWKIDSEEDFLKHKNQALLFVESRVAHFNKFYKYSWNRLTIKNQKTRWGSCSKKGNLNFNYKIVFLPEHLAEYIIVHELCHLGEFNHSRKFWNLVAKAIPDYSEIRDELRRKELRFQ